MIAQVTGGTPFSAGVFYDDSYDRTFFPPSSNCAGTPGAETTYAENLDKSLADVTGGGKLRCRRSTRPTCRRPRMPTGIVSWSFPTSSSG
jgi:hypothetical protein